MNCHVVNNDYEQDSGVFYTFAPNKSFSQLLDILPKKKYFSKSLTQNFRTLKQGLLCKSLSGKQSQRLLDHAKQSATNALKTSSEIVLQDTAEATSDLSGNKIANKIRKVSKNSQQNNLEIVINDNDKEMPKGRYMSPDKRQDIIDDLRLKYQYNNEVSKNNKLVRKYTKSTKK